MPYGMYRFTLRGMATPATSHLGRLIDDYQRRHSASISGLAGRIGITRQTLRQWRVGELRSLPTQTNLSSAAAEIGCPYAQVLDAALRDVGYLGEEDSRQTDAGLPLVAASPFIQNALIAERYTPAADDWLHETAHGPGIWTMAHRGYSGSRRLDLWAYPDEESALRAAARLGLECGLDEDAAAVDAFERGDYQKVLDRHRDTAPPWQVLAVTLTRFVGEDSELVITSSGLEHGTPPTTSPTPDVDLDGDWATEDDDEFGEIVAMIPARQAELIAQAGDEIAADIRSDADTLSSAAVAEANREELRVLSALPAVTFDQSRLWRYQLAAAAERLAGDTRRWGAPIPRCAGEEMALHLILRRAKSLARPRQVRRGSWDLLFEVLFQDHDVLMLFELPPDAAESLAGGVNLHPRRWFSEFTLPFPMPDRP